MSRLRAFLQLGPGSGFAAALLIALASGLLAGVAQGSVQSDAQNGSPAQPVVKPGDPPASATPASAVPISGVPWWHLLLVHIDEPSQPDDAKSNYFTRHPLDLLIPAGWKLTGEVDWPQHRGKPSLTFRVDSPDGRTGLEYLPQESWRWSEDPAARAEVAASGVKLQPLPPLRATDYLRDTLLPKLRPGAQVIAVESLPGVARYLNDELVGKNTADQVEAQQKDIAVPKSSADAARAHIAYVRDGVPVEEWVEIAVEHLQRHAGAASWSEMGTGKMIDTFALLECDILRARPGSLERESRVLGNILAQLQQNESWTEQVSYEYWHGKFNDRIYYFQHSYFGNDSFYFDDPVLERETYGFAYRNAWRNESGDQFVVTDAADFDPNGKVGSERWIRLKPQTP